MMKRIRYLTLLMLLLGSISAGAQSDFNPDSPAEPGVPPMKLEIAVVPAEAGSVSGAGRYAEGTKVSLSAYTNTGFHFVSWTNANGEVLATTASFVYTKGAGHEKLTANYVFDPTAPNDPAEPSSIMYYQLQLSATEGGSVSGGGRYLAGQRITLSAYPESQFDFDGWYDGSERLSDSRSFSYTTTAKHRTIEARFVFNPDSPNDPSDPALKPKHNIYVTANEGGSTNVSTLFLQEGATTTLRAYTNSGYTFVGWYLNGELLTPLAEFVYTVTTEQTQNLEARFEFTPDSPAEPGMPTTTKHAFFLMNKVTTPGTTVKFPIYLSNVRTIKDMTFQLSFEEEVLPNLQSVSMSERATGYTISCDVLENNTYVFSFIGGSVPAGNAAIIVFDIPVSKDIITAKGYPIKINQVTVTEEDGTVTTGSTRNGRISVYKMGDTNGDNEVNEVDAQLILDVSVGQKSLSDLAVPEVIDVPGGNSAAYEVNAQIVLDYSVATVKPW